jgi:hypothetical protein
MNFLSYSIKYNFLLTDIFSEFFYHYFTYEKYFASNFAMEFNEQKGVF